MQQELFCRFKCFPAPIYYLPWIVKTQFGNASSRVCFRMALDLLVVGTGRHRMYMKWTSLQTKIEQKKIKSAAMNNAAADVQFISKNFTAY